MHPRAIEVKPIEDYKLLVTFNNDEKRIFNVEPYFDFLQFKDLKNKALFNTVHIAGISIEWQNGVDICPDELYYDSLPI